MSEYTPETLRQLRFIQSPSVALLESHAEAWEAAVEENERRCLWSEDLIDSKWDTACGYAFVLTTGDPADNEMRFCPYCGGHLEVALAQEKPK